MELLLHELQFRGEKPVSGNPDSLFLPCSFPDRSLFQFVAKGAVVTVKRLRFCNNEEDARDFPSNQGDQPFPESGLLVVWVINFRFARH